MTKISFCIALVAMSGAAEAGITVKSVDDRGAASVISIEGNRLRIDDARQVLIYDGDKKELINADPRKHTYSSGNENDMKRMGADMKKQMEASQAEMRKQMASMPPEQRKQMEEAQKQMQQSAGSSVGGKAGRPTHASAREPVKYEPLGEKKQIAGHSCDLYRVVRGHGSTEKACFIPWGEGVVKKDELKVFDNFADFMGVMTESMGGSREDSRGGWSRELRDAPGLPALIVGASGKTTMQLKSIERGPIGTDKFSPPTGYQKSSKGMFGQ